MPIAQMSMVSVFALQLCDIEARSSNVDDGRRRISECSTTCSTRAEKKEKRQMCLVRRERGQEKYQRLSDYENEDEGPSYESVRPRDVQAMRHTRKKLALFY